MCRKFNLTFFGIDNTDAENALANLRLPKPRDIQVLACMLPCVGGNRKRYA